MEYILEKKDGDLRYVMTAIDCPGHSNDKPIKEWYNNIKTYAKKKVRLFGFKNALVNTNMHK
jgi:hypothetical protein